MNQLAAKPSPRAIARIAGVFEALEGFSSAYGQVVILGKLVIPTSAAVTAANILAHQRLYWLGFVLSLAGVMFHIVWIVLFYDLFKPVNRTLSRLACFVGIIVCGIQALTAHLYLTPFLVLQTVSSTTAFTPSQLQSLALLVFKWNSYAFNIDLVFFGLWCALTGYLIFYSTFLPRVLGVLLAVDGLGWMLYMYPPVAYHLFPVIAATSALAEIPLQLWLIIMGVNNQRWHEQASIANSKST